MNISEDFGTKKQRNLISILEEKERFVKFSQKSCDVFI